MSVYKFCSSDLIWTKVNNDLHYYKPQYLILPLQVLEQKCKQEQTAKKNPQKIT